MQRMIPEKTKVRVELFRGVTIGDLIVGAIGIGLLILVLISNLPYKVAFCIAIIAIAALLLVRMDSVPNYQYIGHILSYYGYKRKFVRACTDEELIAFSEEDMDEASLRKSGRNLKGSGKTLSGANMDEIIPFTGISDDQIEYLHGQYYGAVIQIDPVEFRFFSEHRRNVSIENCFGRILRSISPDYCCNIVKLEQPIIYDRYLEREYAGLEALSDSYENGMLSEEELKARVEIKYDRINELQDYSENNHIITPFYYLVLFESDRRRLELQIRDAVQQLTTGELKVRRLMDRELAVFLKYTNQIDFDEHDVEKIRDEDLIRWAQPDSVDIRVRKVEVNRIVTHNMRVVNFPTMVDDAWLAGVLSVPATKVVVKFKPMDRTKSIRNIDRSLQELRGQWSDTGIDSRRMEIESHIETLQNLLFTLQNDNEALMETNIYISAYDINATRNLSQSQRDRKSDLPVMTDMKKNIRRIWQEASFRLNNMEFDQVQAFIGSQVSGLDPMAKEGRGIPSNTIAASYPWIFAHVSDEGGVKLGESEGVPVFVDFFRRDSERVNSNMVIVGKSGSGKSYATKSLLANLAAEDAKIFILDPENEYTDLARNLHGQMINVGNAQYGRLNPFHIITSLDDDETGEGSAASGSYATHLQFLEEFFRQIIPDCEKDAMEYLNTLVDHMYLMHNITPETDLSALRPEDYPVFDDLYDEVLEEFQKSDNPFTRDMLGTLMNYIAKFSTGGRNANIWNGPSTVTTDENITVFNFQSMLANRNQTIANAQMLLVLKYIDNEIIKNRDYNLRFHANRKIVVVIDEAHVFIDAKFPIALDFMFQLAKRIRKYNGMQIVITQNIKDFVGSDDLMRKSAAIINACQYSFIFALAPNDMQDLVNLYANAGGINESEQEEIVQAPRGQAFTILSPTSRSSFQINTSPGIVEMFEAQNYESRYFSGPEGADNWEDFVGVSRAQHEEAVAQKRRREEIETRERVQHSSGVTLNIFDEDEYEDYLAQNAGTAVSLSYSEEPEVSLSFIEEEPEPVKEEPVPLQPIRNDTPQSASVAGDPAAMTVFSMIANALDRMATAAERSGENPLMGKARNTGTVPAGSAGSAESEENRELREKDEEIQRMREEMNERLRALREENERLRAGEEPEEEDLELYEEDNDFAADLFGDDLEDDEDDEDYDEYETEVLNPFGDADDDAYPEEEEGEIAMLFGAPDDYDEDLDNEDNFSDYEDEDEYDEDEDEFDGEEDFDDGEDSDNDDDDDDFMSSFCNFAASLMNMSPFEKMRANGRLVEEMTLDDLIAEVEAQRERRRKAG
ncbi:MAG: DUF87 domain-containing protein [Lachnospiraceae bacterium]|nr:DUF87 domain-containing protein [Lachnospiraceae bacterium]